MATDEQRPAPSRLPQIAGMLLRAIILGELLVIALFSLWAARSGGRPFVYMGF